MSRKPRILSNTNVYHVILRGVNRQVIFWDSEDRLMFINRLSRYKDISGYELFAYCLMDNHIHLLMRVEKEPLEKVFRRILDSYVYWYNAKYERCGNLFQDRYKSEPIDDERYFLNVLHYIVYNPVVAGICVKPEEYEYSSAAEYILMHPGITDTNFAYELKDRKSLKKFLKKPSDVDCVNCLEDHPIIVRLRDQEAAEIITKKIGKKVPVDREKLMCNIGLFLEQGISMRQISRITSLSRTVLYRLMSEE